MITSIIYTCSTCGGSFAISPEQDESEVMYCVICGAKLGAVIGMTNGDITYRTEFARADHVHPLTRIPLGAEGEYIVFPPNERIEGVWLERRVYDAMQAELADLREQVRWRKYPEEKPDGRKGRMLEIVTRPSGHRIPYCIYDVEEEVFFEARKHEHQYSAFSVTHFRYMPHPPEEA